MAVKAVDKRRLGRKIRQLRESQNPRLSQRKLALEAEITNASLSDIENGINFPSEDLLLRLVTLLNPKESIKQEIYDIYARAKGGPPPDISAYLRENEKMNELLRRLIHKQVTEEDFERLIQVVDGIPDTDIEE